MFQYHGLTKILVFRSAAKSGPGTYGKDGIPHAALEEANRVSLLFSALKVVYFSTNPVFQRPVTSIGSLDSGRHNDRSMPLFGTDLAPGRYEYQSFTDELLSRQGLISYLISLNRIKKLVLIGASALFTRSGEKKLASYFH